MALHIGPHYQPILSGMKAKFVGIPLPTKNPFSRGACPFILHRPFLQVPSVVFGSARVAPCGEQYVIGKAVGTMRIWYGLLDSIAAEYTGTSVSKIHRCGVTGGFVSDYSNGRNS